MFRKLTLFSVVLTLIILVLGSLVRLANVEPGGFTPDLITILNGTVHHYLTAT